MPKATTFGLATLVEQIRIDYPNIRLVSGERFAWHGSKKQLLYKDSVKDTPNNIFSLLHELGHAILDHRDYSHDIELIQLEAVAWEKARNLSDRYSIKLDEDYIQDCLDTYRDWLHLRATCPTCFTRSLQASTYLYRCFNCQTNWSVTRSRLCRPYRLKTIT